jgi:hypoxanthine-DNA glycosylase
MSLGFSTLIAPALVVDEQSRVLILGASSGKTSARKGQHYAGHGNVFWNVLGKILGFQPDLAYSDRIDRLRKCGIAIWNVCGVASRSASSYRAEVAYPNDFAALFKSHPAIDTILFNGVEAERIYGHRVLPRLHCSAYNMTSLILPSTSPLHSKISFEEKRAQWLAAFERAKITPKFTE